MRVFIYIHPAHKCIIEFFTHNPPETRNISYTDVLAFKCESQSAYSISIHIDGDNTPPRTPAAHNQPQRNRGGNEVQIKEILAIISLYTTSITLKRPPPRDRYKTIPTLSRVRRTKRCGRAIAHTHTHTDTARKEQKQASLSARSRVRART